MFLLSRGCMSCCFLLVCLCFVVFIHLFSPSSVFLPWSFIFIFVYIVKCLFFLLFFKCPSSCLVRKFFSFFECLPACLVHHASEHFSLKEFQSRSLLHARPLFLEKGDTFARFVTPKNRAICFPTKENPAQVPGLLIRPIHINGPKSLSRYARPEPAFRVNPVFRRLKIPRAAAGLN